MAVIGFHVAGNNNAQGVVASHRLPSRRKKEDRSLQWTSARTACAPAAGIISRSGDSGEDDELIDERGKKLLHCIAIMSKCVTDLFSFFHFSYINRIMTKIIIIVNKMNNAMNKDINKEITFFRVIPPSTP